MLTSDLRMYTHRQTHTDMCVYTYVHRVGRLAKSKTYMCSAINLGTQPYPVHSLTSLSLPNKFPFTVVLAPQMLWMMEDWKTKSAKQTLTHFLKNLFLKSLLLSVCVVTSTSLSP